MVDSNYWYQPPGGGQAVPLAGNFGTSGGMGEALPPGVTLGQPKAAPAPASVPAVKAAVVTPKVSNLFSAPSAADTPLAAGFPMLSQMIDYTLRAQNQEQVNRRADIQQSVDIARLMADLERVSPTRAAAMAASMGIKPGGDFSFANLFGTGTNFPLAGGNRVKGNIGGVNVSLPSVFSGQELSFFNANPNVSRVVMDIADALGIPDIFSRSLAARLPTMSSIFAGGI